MSKCFFLACALIMSNSTLSYAATNEQYCTMSANRTYDRCNRDAHANFERYLRSCDTERSLGNPVRCDSYTYDDLVKASCDKQAKTEYKNCITHFNKPSGPPNYQQDDNNNQQDDDDSGQ